MTTPTAEHVGGMARVVRGPWVGHVGQITATFNGGWVTVRIAHMERTFMASDLVVA